MRQRRVRKSSHANTIRKSQIHSRKYDHKKKAKAHAMSHPFSSILFLPLLVELSVWPLNTLT